METTSIIAIVILAVLIGVGSFVWGVKVTIDSFFNPRRK